MNRILVVLEAGAAYPSGVIRGLIYQDHFRRAGIDARFMSRLPPGVIRLAEHPPAAVRWLFGATVRRSLARLANLLARVNEWRIVRAARDYDVVYMSKISELRLMDALRRGTRARLVLDFGDAQWLPGRGGPAFTEVLRRVDAVTTDNEDTARFVRQHNPNCIVVPDCPQVERFDTRRGAVAKRTDRVTIGWIGTPGTLYNLYVVWEALEKLFMAYPALHLRLVGSGPDASRLPPFTRVRFSERKVYDAAEMVDEVLAMDIGLFPLQDVEASQVRGVLKATVYMSGEAVVVASPVGQTLDLVRDGENGLLAGTTDEWVSCIERLIADAGLRRRLAAAGLETVRAGFRVEQSFAKLMTVLQPQREDAGMAVVS